MSNIIPKERLAIRTIIKSNGKTVKYSSDLKIKNEIGLPYQIVIKLKINRKRMIHTNPLKALLASEVLRDIEQPTEYIK